MEIKFNGPVTAFPLGAVSKRLPAAQAEQSDQVKFNETYALEKKLEDVPDIRPEAVARARALMADGNYPSPEVISKIATILASRLANDSSDAS